MLIHNAYINNSDVISAEIKEVYKNRNQNFFGRKNFETELHLVITLRQKIIDGASIGAVGYKHKELSFLLSNYEEGIGKLSELNGEDFNETNMPPL